MHFQRLQTSPFEREEGREDQVMRENILKDIIIFKRQIVNKIIQFNLRFRNYLI